MDIVVADEQPVPQALLAKSTQLNLLPPKLDRMRKAVLWSKRCGYPSPARLVDAINHQLIFGTNLPADIKVEDFLSADIPELQLATSKAQPHRNL